MTDFFDAQPVTTATSTGFAISSPAVRATDPWDTTAFSWTEIENSTTEAWGGFYVATISPPKGMIQIAKGAASSEVIIATLPLKTYANADCMNTYVPVPVASGTRLSIRATVEATGTIEGQVIGIPSTNFDAEPSFTVLETGPYNLNNTTNYGEGVEIDTDGTANSKGSWTELSNANTNNVIQGDSLGQSYGYLGLLFHDNANPAQTTQTRLWDVALGASGSETLIAENFHDIVMNTERGALGSAVMWVPWGRASGDRISARLQSTDTNANDRKGSLFLFGVR